jgi:alpha-L-fucosidase
MAAARDDKRMERRTLIAAGLAAASSPLLHRIGIGGHLRRPVPSAAQLRWQREELAIFVHFTVNTFTGREWGDGSESPSLFDPAALDARQWARIAKGAGARAMILTAKHHDGFCLWPTRTTDHSVRASPWRGGAGDVVREFVDACRAEQLGAGLYLSPWDRHEPSYGDTPRYNDFYDAQLRELLSGYGPIGEVWFDGANGEGPNGRRQEYDWPRIHRTVRELQPDAVIFSDAGPDVRWIGNEKGVAGETCWSTIDPAAVPYPGFDGPGVGEVLQRGDPDGSVWRPGETDVSIRPGWFWHAEEDERVRSADNVLDLYFTSVGRNSKLLLNVPPTRDGVFHPTDVARLGEFGLRLRALRDTDLAAGARIDRSGGTVALTLPRPVSFDVISLQEDIGRGQVVERYRVEAETAGGWAPISRGTTIGYRKLDQVTPLAASRVRLVIESALGTPHIARVSLHRRG